ncbi:MAG TPA: hypothetical protein DCE41_36520 [Cytophagales bacterium]|nr:hypothetical protein [Cytophagales bacterium]HAA18358.1 hypothetical protein [Cytophagales bacterium]HAP60342.1 hypothetical protein [Cytophagales bacterium]
MAEVPSISQLYQKYTAERPTSVTEEQFVTFTVFFPNLIIIISDGVIDLEEWEYVKQLARFMAKSFKDEGDEQVNVEGLADCYLREISYLIKFLADWRDAFLDALQPYLASRPDAKTSILDTIQLFAEASEGTSDEEQAQIDEIKNRLQLES